VELLIVNPRKRGQKPRRVKRKRKTTARKLKLSGGPKPRVRRKKSSVKKKTKKAASARKKKGTTGMATVRRYKKKARRNAKRRVSAKQRAAARRNIKKAQAARRKKTRKKAVRKNPRRRAKATPRRAAKRRSKAKRARRTVRSMKRRANPAKKKTTARKKKSGGRKKLTQYQRLQREASRLGIKATGSMGRLEARIAQAKGLSPKATAAKRRRKKKGGRKRVAGKRATWAYSHRKRSRPVRGKKRRRSTAKAKVARAYLGAKRVQSGISRGKIGGDAAKMAKAMGLTRVNPVGLKTMWKDLKTVAPMVGMTVGGMVGMLALGMKASAKLSTVEMVQKLPAPIQKNLVPLTTATVTLGSVALIKKVKALAKLQKYTMPIRPSTR
jgi:hypothetical protein